MRKSNETELEERLRYADYLKQLTFFGIAIRFVLLVHLLSDCSGCLSYAMVTPDYSVPSRPLPVS